MEINDNHLIEGTVVMIDSYKKGLAGFVPKAIKWFTGAKYHHAGIVASRKEDGDRLWVYEAVAEGFVPTCTVEDWQKKVGVQFGAVYSLPHTNIIGADYLFRERLYQIEGSPYDFFSLILWQSIYQLYKKLGMKGKWLGNKGSRAKNTIYCTEAVAYILGYEEWWAYDPKRLYDRIACDKNRKGWKEAN